MPHHHLDGGDRRFLRLPHQIQFILVLDHPQLGQGRMDVDQIDAGIMLPHMTGKPIGRIVRFLPALLRQIQPDAHAAVAAVQLHLTMDEIQHFRIRIHSVDIGLLLRFLRFHPAADPAGLFRIKRLDKQHRLNVIAVFNQRQRHRFPIQAGQIVEIAVDRKRIGLVQRTNRRFAGKE